MIPSQKSKQETLLVSELLIDADNAKLLLILYESTEVQLFSSPTVMVYVPTD